ncbi:MAG: hypothetical protein ABI895_34945 [Deltaproteobacteria bacterium]
MPGSALDSARAARVVEVLGSSWHPTVVLELVNDTGRACALPRVALLRRDARTLEGISKAFR